MDLKIIAHLILLARKKGEQIIGYQQLCNECKISLQMNNPADVQTLSESLTRISQSEHQQGRPLLSAIVYDKNAGRPGKGFFAMAKDLKKYNGSDDEIKKIEFFAKELKDVYLFWQSH